jgi:hypothetical protein
MRDAFEIDKNVDTSNAGIGNRVMNSATATYSQMDSTCIETSDATWAPRKSRFPDDLCLEIVGKLDALKLLPENWDTYGAPCIDLKIIDAAKTMAKKIASLTNDCPDVIPTSLGGVQLEWDRMGKGLELEFETPSRVRFLKWDPSHDAVEEDVYSWRSTAHDRTKELLQWIAS